MRAWWVLPTVLLLLAGCTDFDREPDGPANRIGILSIDVAAPEVSTGTITLVVTTTLDNLEAESGVLQVQVKAFDSATNMLAANATAQVGAIAKDTSKAIPIPLSLPRASGYRLEVLIHQDGRIVQEGSVAVSNLEALEPTIFDTGLKVAQIDAQVLDLDGGRVRVGCTVYITNEAGTASRPLRLQLKAREVSTSILADEEWLDVPSVGRDETAAHRLELEVPDDFNYALEAFIWDGPVIVERGMGKVQFLPTYEAPNNTQLKVTNPDISVFDADGRRFGFGDAAYGSGGGPSYYGGGPSTTSSAATPGFTLPILVASLAGAVLLLRRRSKA